MTNVKCGNCGLMGVRIYETRQLVEAELTMRKHGHSPLKEKPGTVEILDSWPVCVAGLVDFHEEMHWQMDPEVRQAALHKERDCASFVAWHPGLNPREHLEMLHHERLERYERERAERDHRWRVYELLLVGVIVTIVSVAAQIAAAFIGRGSWFPDPRPPIAAEPDGFRHGRLERAAP